MADVGRMHPLRLPLLPFDEAKRLVLEAMPPTTRIESAAIADALGRVAAEDVRAPIDVPGFDRSAMDGYAVRAADTSKAKAGAPARLRIVGAAHAGAPLSRSLGKGECAEIATGAPVPPGADAVVMVERTRRHGEEAWVEGAVAPGENVSSRGGDLRRGDVAVPVGSLFTPARLAVLAALGLERVNVFARPRVALVSTGSELREPGEELSAGLIYDSNSTSLSAVLAGHGARVEASGIVPDEPGRLRTALERLRDADLFVVTGSSSAGEKDYLEETVRGVGSVAFHGVAVKPGKPLLLGRAWGTPVLGLAGNPASCLLMAYVLVVPAVRQFQHLALDWERRVGARLAHDVAPTKDRKLFVPVRVREGTCESVFKESDATTSLAHADGYVEVVEGSPGLQRGATVEVRLF